MGGLPPSFRQWFDAHGLRAPVFDVNGALTTGMPLIVSSILEVCANSGVSATAGEWNPPLR